MTSVLLAVPCYNNVLHAPTALSIIEVLSACYEAQIRVDLLVTHGESAITRGRSNMAAAFLRSDCDTLAFLDADVAISGEDFVRLVRLKKPIRGAAVSLKTLDHTESLSVFKDGKRLSRQELVMRGEADLRRIAKEKNIENVTAVTCEPVEVDYLGGALMLIERDVIDTLSRLYAYLRYQDPIAGPGVHLFEEIVTGGKLLSEDFAFCHRARDKGFSVWCDPTIKVSHFEGRSSWRF
jgi:hypothetical protein